MNKVFILVIVLLFPLVILSKKYDREYVIYKLCDDHCELVNNIYMECGYYNGKRSWYACTRRNYVHVHKCKKACEYYYY